MDNAARKRIDSIVGRVKVRTQQAIERDLSIAREMYHAKRDREKQLLRDWISKAVDLANTGIDLKPAAVLLVEFVQPDVDGDDLAVTMSVTAAKRAIACWDRNEHYLPSLTEFCGVDILYKKGT